MWDLPVAESDQTTITNHVAALIILTNDLRAKVEGFSIRSVYIGGKGGHVRLHLSHDSLLC